MGATHFSGPVLAGDLQQGETNGPNQGLVQLVQFAALAQNGTNAVSATLYIPAGAQILGFNIDVLTAWNSGTSATLSIGTAAAGTQYVSGVSVATTGRKAPTYTAAQLAAMSGVSVTGAAAATTPPIVITVTPVGTAADAGYLEVAVLYVQQ